MSFLRDIQYSGRKENRYKFGDFVVFESTSGRVVAQAANMLIIFDGDTEECIYRNNEPWSESRKPDDWCEECEHSWKTYLEWAEFDKQIGDLL